MTHPSSLDLEAFACGEDPRATVTDHLVICTECRVYVERLGGLIATRPTAGEAEALIARALAKAKVVEEPRDKSRLWLRTTYVITPLAAAAAIVLLVRSGGVELALHPARGAAAGASAPALLPPYRIQMATQPEPDTTFKGGRQLAVVRERSGEQARFASSVVVRPGDRLRVEVALDREQAILGAVLSDDGTYLELMPLAVRGPGTHFSERSAKIDGTPTSGTIVIGSPEAVARARATHQLDGVSTLRVEWEGKP